MQHIGKPTYVNRDGRGFAARFSAPTGRRPRLYGAHEEEWLKGRARLRPRLRRVVESARDIVVDADHCTHRARKLVLCA